jgi:hypothetical protein
MRLGLGLGLASENRIGLGGSGGADLPVLRRDLLQEDNFFVLMEDASKIVITFGTFDSLDLENGDFLLQEDNGKLSIQSN